MASASFAVTSFLGGEWSQWAQGRFDRPDYRTALNVCLNFIPTEQGSAPRRPGTQFLATTRNGQPGRLVSFDIKQSSPLLIEFTAGMLRFYQNAVLVTTNDDQVVSSISTANPAVVTTAAPHGWPSGSNAFSVKFTLLGTTCLPLQNRVFLATRTGASTFSLADAVTGANIVGSTLGVAGLAAAAKVQRILEVPSPYTGMLWQNVRVVQTEQAALLLHPAVPPQVLKATAPGPTQTFYSFTLGAALLQDGPYLDPLTNGAQLLPSATNGNITLTLQFASWSSAISYAIGAFVLYSSINYQSAVDQNQNNQPSYTLTTNGTTAAGNAVLHFAATTGIIQGMTVTDNTSSVIPAGTTVLSTTVNTVTISNNVTGGGVGNGDSIFFGNVASWTAVSAGLAVGPNGFVGSDIGRLLRLNDSAGNWTWGKITAVQYLISATLSGSVNFGNMVGGAGLAAAFNGLLTQAAAASAAVAAGNLDPFSGYIGKNYSGASAQKIGHAVLWPSSDLGLAVASLTFTQTTTFYLGVQNPSTLAYYNGAGNGWTVGTGVGGASSGAGGTILSTGGNVATGQLNLTNVTGTFLAREQVIDSATVTQATVYSYTAGVGATWQQQSQSSQQYTIVTQIASIIVNLRAKQTAPASASDGTLLGQAPYTGGPVTVTSNDQNTAWNYVWFEIVCSSVNQALPANVDTRSNPPVGGASAYTLSYVENSFAITDYVSQAQFYGPPGSGSGNAVTFQILGAALANTNALTTWQLGVYSGTTGYPTCGTYHEARLWLAGAVGNRLDASVSNQALAIVNGITSSIVNFAPTTVAGLVLGNSAIAAVFSAPDVNTIFWLVPDSAGIIVGTQAGDWLAQASALNNPLSPTNFQVHRFSRLGCANIEPRRANHALIWVQRFGRKLLEYFADAYSGKLGAQNLTWACRHLTKSGIAEIAYQAELAPIIWARCNDGSLFGITYKREVNLQSNPPNFVAPHRHKLGSGRVVESIAVGPSADGTVDSLAMVTNDLTSNIRHVEIMTNLFEEGAAQTAAWFLDDAVNPTSTTSTNVASVGRPYGALTINGLWHLNSFVVTVFVNGLDCGDYQVSAGSVTVPYGDGISGGTGGGLFTAARAVAGPIVVGFTYNSDGQLVRPATPAESGARSGPALGKIRRTMQLAAQLDNTVAISFGTDFGKLKPAQFKTPAGIALAPGQAFSGVYWDMLDDEYSFDSMPCWRASRPYSATVVALEPFLATADK